RGARRRRAIDRGFVLSDHVDWPALLAAIEATGAENVRVTHRYRDQVVRYLSERGLNACAIASHWEGENDEAPAAADESAIACTRSRGSTPASTWRRPLTRTSLRCRTISATPIVPTR